MGDKTYCNNSQCPFVKCERHLSKINKNHIKNKVYISVANFANVCRKYNRHLVNETERSVK